MLRRSTLLLADLKSWGIVSNGKLLTAKTSEFPKTESGLSLSDILEKNVEDKYFLSLEQQAKILGKLETYIVDKENELTQTQAESTPKQEQVQP